MIRQLWRIAAKVNKWWYIGVTTSVFLYLGTLNHIEAHEVGLTRNLFTGTLAIQSPGWYVTWPWVQVAQMDTRPMRVCITSSGRGYNCKLVRFAPEAYAEFVSVEGFRYYWWANRVSFNLGYNEEYRGLKDILRGHAFGVTPYAFIVVGESAVP